MKPLDGIKEMVVRGRIDAKASYPKDMAGQPGVVELVTRAIDADIPVVDILKKALISGMDEVGKKFSAGEYFVPDMLLSARAMKAGLKILEPHLVEADTKKIGTVVLGTVFGDLHDIGKNLVGMMLEGAGFEVIDLGVNVQTEKFIEHAKKHSDAVIGMSALLTTTMVNMQNIISEFKNQGLSNKVIIGGAATSQEFADEIHADGYSRDASGAVTLVRDFIKDE